MLESYTSHSIKKYAVYGKLNSSYKALVTQTIQIPHNNQETLQERRKWEKVVSEEIKALQSIGA